MNYNWQQVRLSLLGCCSLGILLSLGTNLLPAKSSPEGFPNRSVFQKWEAIETDKIEPQEPIQGKRDRRRVSGERVTVEVYYLANYILGNERLIQKYQETESLPEIKVVEHSTLGHYGLWTEGNKTRLNTCIHSQGKTAFTQQQLSELANQNLSKRWLPWFLGKADLRDWDCLWVNMSISTDKLSERETANLLAEQLQKLVTAIAKFN